MAGEADAGCLREMSGVTRRRLSLMNLLDMLERKIAMMLSKQNYICYKLLYD